MGEAKRERRIRDKLRMKAKAAVVYPRDPKRRHADNLACCSCHMCRSPRRSHFYKGAAKLTMQERRAFQSST